MIQLTLLSPKGNQGIRFFPYSGYLGLTPIHIDGTVRTKLHELEPKPLLVKTITISVRCYEARLGFSGVGHTNTLVDHTQTLWSKPDFSEYAAVGELDLPFHISLPPSIGGVSTSTFVEYRCFWRIEACVEHIPIPRVGSRILKHFDLPFVRYSLPDPLLINTTSRRSYIQTARPGATAHLRYRIDLPTAPVGPLDLISISIYLQPLSPSVSIRRASVVIERRIRYRDSGSSHPSSASSSLNERSRLHLPSSMFSPSFSLTHRGNAPEPLHGASRSSRSHHSPDTYTCPSDGMKTSVTSIVGTESSGLFTLSDDGVWSKTLTLQWPAAKSTSRWAVGETLKTDLVSVKFYVCVKVYTSSSTGHECTDLEAEEILVVSTTESERQAAQARYTEALSMRERSRSKSKSPKRSHLSESPTSGPPLPAMSTSPPAVDVKARRGTKRSFRRPHTSAGPRDNSFGLGGVRMDGVTDRRNLEHYARGPDSGRMDTFPTPPRLVSPQNSDDTQASSMTTKSQGSAISRSRCTNSSTASDSQDEIEKEKIVAWERELARIEDQSRRSSNLLGFARFRKKSRILGG